MPCFLWHVYLMAGAPVSIVIFNKACFVSIIEPNQMGIGYYEDWIEKVSETIPIS